MARVQDLIDVAMREVGYSRWDDPEEGTKYGRWYANLVGEPWYGTNGVPFCAMGGSWVAATAGVASPVTPDACTFDERCDLKGRRVDKWHLLRGDFVTFDWLELQDDGTWARDGRGDHFGICLDPVGDGWYDVWEANTDGGVVAIKRRHADSIICGCRPYYDDAAPLGALDVDGIAGPATVRAWQDAMGTGSDGVVSDQLRCHDQYRRNVWSVDHYALDYVDDHYEGSALVREVQVRCGLTGAMVDGDWGMETSMAIQRVLRDMGHYGGGIDGDFGRHSVEALQLSLNAGQW